MSSISIVYIAFPKEVPMPQRYPRIGEQITRLTRSLVAVKGWDKKYTMDYVGNQTGYSPDMVYRWW